MSRSYKRTAGWKDRAGKYMKKFANKKVRNTKIIPNGMFYKKLFESWNISDYAFLYWNKKQVKRKADKYYNGNIYRFYMK